MRGHLKSILVIFGIIIILIILHNFNLLNPVENLFFTITKPIQKPFYSLSDKIFNTEEKKNIEQLENDNEELQSRLKQLINENSRLTALVSEYQELNSQLQYIEAKEYNYLPARILAKSSDQASQTIIINQGSDQGIIPGLPVIVEDGFLIGKIDSVEKNRSTVLLITDSYCQFTGQVQGQNNTSGITEGQHGLSLALTLVPKTEELSEQQIIVTAGLEENVPTGLIIGEVESIDSPPGELWQTALLNTLVDFKTLEIVSVLLP